MKHLLFGVLILSIFSFYNQKFSNVFRHHEYNIRNNILLGDSLKSYLKILNFNCLETRIEKYTLLIMVNMCGILLKPCTSDYCGS